MIKQHYCTSKKVGTHGNWVFGLTFKGDFGFTNIFLKLTMKNQVVKAMVEHTNENSMIKLWHQLGTNSMLIVCLFELMRLVNLAIL
jgi:hypothetical protein